MADIGIAPLVLAEQVDPRILGLKRALLHAQDQLVENPARIYGFRLESKARPEDVYYLQTTHKDTWLKLGRLTEDNHVQLIDLFEWHYEETGSQQIFFSFRKGDKTVWLVTRSTGSSFGITYTLSPA